MTQAQKRYNFKETTVNVVSFELTISNKKRCLGFKLFSNNSIGVMEHFLHMSNEISRNLKITIQEYQTTDKDFHYF